MPFDLTRVKSQQQVHYFETIGSTMTEALRIAAHNAPHGTVVLADEQTAGIGRLGRTWHSSAGFGLYCSIILRLNLPPASAPMASLLVGLAVADAIQKTTDLLCDLRWPNDVLIRERKVAGILMQWADGAAIAGIGVNVNHLSFPGDLRTPATSLRIECNGREQSREDLLTNLLASLEFHRQKLDAEGLAGITSAFNAASSYARNRRVVVEETGQVGITQGLDENGFLLIKLDDQSIQRLAAGGVRPVSG